MGGQSRCFHPRKLPNRFLGNRSVGASGRINGTKFRTAFYDHIYWHATKLLEAFVFNLDIPTIACINGPGFHTEFALLCDITLCADHAVLFDRHFGDLGAVPGDSQGLTFQELMGLKRAAYWPLDRLLPRAWEIGEKIMKKLRTVRRLTSAVLRRPWKRLLVQDLGFHLGHELLGIRLDGGCKRSDSKNLREMVCARRR